MDHIKKICSKALKKVSCDPPKSHNDLELQNSRSAPLPNPGSYRSYNNCHPAMREKPVPVPKVIDRHAVGKQGAPLGWSHDVNHDGNGDPSIQEDEVSSHHLNRLLSQFPAPPATMPLASLHRKPIRPAPCPPTSRAGLYGRRSRTEARMNDMVLRQRKGELADSYGQVPAHQLVPREMVSQYLSRPPATSRKAPPPSLQVRMPHTHSASTSALSTPTSDKLPLITAHDQPTPTEYSEDSPRSAGPTPERYQPVIGKRLISGPRPLIQSSGRPQDMINASIHSLPSQREHGLYHLAEPLRHGSKPNASVPAIAFNSKPKVSGVPSGFGKCSRRTRSKENGQGRRAGLAVATVNGHGEAGMRRRW